MLAWKEKVADRLARLLADSPVSPSPAQAAVAPSQAKSFPAEPFIPPKTSSLSSYVFSLLPTSNLGHEQNSPCSETLRPLPPESRPKQWRGSDLTWKDSPLELSEESGSESERDERNGNFGNDQALQSYRSINNSNGNEETSTSDCAVTLRCLTEKSVFVSPKLFAFFQSSLPGTLKGCHWVLLYSTWKHGISLRTLLRRSENIQGPCLLIVGDMQGAVFGGLLNSPLRPTEKRKYQGTNQTFVFTTIHGEPRLFRPTGANRFYYLCLNDALAFGGGGSFALCVDEDLLHGSSGSCETFGNSCLAHSPEFELKNVEAFWELSEMLFTHCCSFQKFLWCNYIDRTFRTAEACHGADEEDALPPLLLPARRRRRRLRAGAGGHHPPGLRGPPPLPPRNRSAIVQVDAAPFKQWHSQAWVEEEMMFRTRILLGRMGIYDQYQDWRLDVDNMTYDELLDLEDRIGHVSTGLREDETIQSLRMVKYSAFNPNHFCTEMDRRCSICQEEFEANEETGKLSCGHSYHVAHILFVDSPVGVGFSFSRDPKGYYVGEISSSLQLHKFLNKWFNEHPEYLANPFYIGGESYAGKTVPFLAQMISEGIILIALVALLFADNNATWSGIVHIYLHCNCSGVEAGMKSAPNLKGYLVGNPSTEERIDFGSRVPYAHGFGIISHQLYEDGRRWLGLRWQQEDEDPTGGEESRVGQQLFHPPARTPFSCFYYGYDLSYFWANDRRTRDALGIKEGTVDEWVRCHDEGELPYERDLESVIKYHLNLTSRGYRALVFSGDHDLLVPHLGTQAWVRSLNFPIVDDWRPGISIYNKLLKQHDVRDDQGWRAYST
ncbi:unnamed protein product [Miscanthus lutarioriparius]|uniref:TLDc domain-containing protein n=1 Tax=Miscanthus lutarioriparius TaxID=422564 RepID=A0A811NPB3_9POAL|nr:unnamed protein product [Miscanthus lutarioriparius]